MYTILGSVTSRTRLYPDIQVELNKNVKLLVYFFFYNFNGKIS